MTSRLFNTTVFMGIRPLALGSILGVGVSMSMLRRPILLNSYYQDLPTTSDKRAIIYEDPTSPTRNKSRFGGRVDYQQMSIGSFTGLFFGYIVGKLSKVLVMMAAGGLLTIQFLQTRGVISGTSTWPFIGDLIHYLRRRLDVRKLASEQPSFKLSFLASFLVAACYA